jgi:RecB family endonuclease NucS
VIEHPRVVGHDLLLVTTEFDRWETRTQRVADRLDVLFVDEDGSPLVAELKRPVVLPVHKHRCNGADRS